MHTIELWYEWWTINDELNKRLDKIHQRHRQVYEPRGSQTGYANSRPQDRTTAQIIGPNCVRSMAVLCAMEFRLWRMGTLCGDHTTVVGLWQNVECRTSPTADVAHVDNTYSSSCVTSCCISCNGRLMLE